MKYRYHSRFKIGSLSEMTKHLWTQEKPKGNISSIKSVLKVLHSKQEWRGLLSPTSWSKSLMVFIEFPLLARLSVGS
jgi:hypothetical protein